MNLTASDRQGLIVSIVFGLVSSITLYVAVSQEKKKRFRSFYWDSKNILRTLFIDFSYDYFATRKLISFLFFISTALVHMTFWSTVIWLIKDGELDLTRLAFAILCLLVFRIISELLITSLKIAENTSRLVMSSTETKNPDF